MNHLPKTYEDLTVLVVKLQQEAVELKRENQALKQENQQLRKIIQSLEKRLSQLERQPPPGLPFHLKPSIKSNKKKAKPKKRDQGYARKKDIPTHIVKHAHSCCPGCNNQLFNGWIKSSRQIIDIPLTPATITEHQVFEHWCSYCQKKVAPQIDLSDQVMGNHRVSLQTMSYIATLRETYRLPFEQIQDQLRVFHQLHLSLGELAEICHTVSKSHLPIYHSLKPAMQRAPVVHGDETGWRENGVNGYIWGFNTPTIQYLTHKKTRSKLVVEEVMGKEFEGVLVSDFYASYNAHEGLHQRCWVHLLRDIKKLTQEHIHNQQVKSWAKKVKGIYQQAKNYPGPDPGKYPNVRSRKRQGWYQQAHFRDQLLKVCRPYLDQEVPQKTLCQRIDRFQDELFVFVTNPSIPSHNNSAERSLRHSVISRKISGGTRSEKGSRTKFILASIFGTWKLQNKNPFQECLRVLTAVSMGKPLPAIVPRV